MKHLRILSLLLVVILLTGCLSPRIDLKTDPKEIKLKYGDEKIEKLDLIVKPSGISFSFKVERVEVVLKGKDGKIVKSGEDAVLSKSINVDKKFPIVPFIPKQTIKLAEELDLSDLFDYLAGGYTEADEAVKEQIYDSEIKGEEFSLSINLFGTKNSSTSTKIKFE